MIQKPYAEDLAGGLEPGGDVDIFLAGFQAAGGVVVGDDDGRGAVGNGVGEDFTWVDLGFVDEADGDDA